MLGDRNPVQATPAGRAAPMADRPSVLSTLREAMARAKHREGVPMVVALVDERQPRSSVPSASDPAVRTDGAALAARLRDTRQLLAPSMREDDNGAVISALVVTAHDLTDATRHDRG